MISGAISGARRSPTRGSKGLVDDAVQVLLMNVFILRGGAFYSMPSEDHCMVLHT